MQNAAQNAAREEARRKELEKEKGAKTSSKGGANDAEADKKTEAQAMKDDALAKKRALELIRQGLNGRTLYPPVSDSSISEIEKRISSVDMKYLDDIRSRYNYNRSGSTMAQVMEQWYYWAEITILEMKLRGEKPTFLGMFGEALGAKLFGMDGTKRIPAEIIEDFFKGAGNLQDYINGMPKAGFKKAFTPDRDTPLQRMKDAIPTPKVVPNKGYYFVENLDGEEHARSRDYVNSRLQEAFPIKDDEDSPAKYKVDKSGHLLEIEMEGDDPKIDNGEPVYTKPVTIKGRGPEAQKLMTTLQKSVKETHMHSQLDNADAEAPSTPIYGTRQ